jgi:hypothetical protein
MRHRGREKGCDFVGVCLACQIQSTKLNNQLATLSTEWIQALVSGRDAEELSCNRNLNIELHIPS